jgi:hypothetical protein
MSALVVALVCALVLLAVSALFLARRRPRAITADRNGHQAIELVDTAGRRVGGVVEYSIQWRRRQVDCEVVVTIGTQTVIGRAGDGFEAFCRVREQLEEQGLRPLCYGASRQVFPSGMDRDMCVGLVACKHVPGDRMTPMESVAIFDTGPDVYPVTVAEQQTHVEQIDRLRT